LLVKSSIKEISLDISNIFAKKLYYAMLLVKSSNIAFPHFFTNMKINQTQALPANLLEDASHLGQQVARLRIARHLTQSEAALRAGLSRNTAYRLEKGDPGLALGQVLRCVDAIAPGKSLFSVLQEDDPSLTTLAARERKKRVREMSATELKKLDF
jgi:DNA-binding XRE family transcriptional regulator